MKILIALTYYRPHYSGLTLYAEREARALAARGHNVTVLTSRYSTDLPSIEEMNGVKIVRPNVWLRISKGTVMPSMPYWSWKLLRRSDIVHLHVPQLDAAFIALIARILGKPVVLTYHCDLRLPRGPIHRIANHASNIANHITASSADIIVVNTQDYADNSKFLQSYHGKIRPVLPPVTVSGADQTQIDSFRTKYNIHPDQKIIGMAARLATEKGVEYLAGALPRVIEAIPNVRVLFVGPYRNILGEENYAAKLEPIIDRLGEHWSYLGILPPHEMASFFHLSDVIVLPSLNSTESYGLVQVESMACGTPVIASDLPGVRIPVKKTGMGMLVPPADAKSLSTAIIKILRNPAQYYGDPDDLLFHSRPDFVAGTYEEIFQELIK
jgi:glycosyltransferase involved in cell wall biosynthesis